MNEFETSLDPSSPKVKHDLPVEVLDQNIINFDEIQSTLTNSDKLRLLQGNIPAFPPQFKFLPLFDSSGLGQNYSAYHLYFQLYMTIFRLMVIMAAISLVFFILIQSTKHFSNEVNFGVVIAYVLCSMVIIRLFRIREENRILQNPILHEEELTQDKFTLLIENLPSTLPKEMLQKYLDERIAIEHLIYTIKKQQNRNFRTSTRKNNSFARSVNFAPEQADHFSAKLRLTEAGRVHPRLIDQAQQYGIYATQIETSLNKNYIIDIIYLQETEKYYKLKRSIRNFQRQIAKVRDVSFKSALTNQLNIAKQEFDQYLRQIARYELYNGTAIVIFDSLRNKQFIKNFFRGPTEYEKAFYELIPCCFGKQYRIQNKFPYVRSAPDPKDIIFNNIYIPRMKRVLKEVLALFIGLVIVGSGVVFILSTRVWYQQGIDKLKVPYIVYGAAYVIISYINKYFADFLIQKFMIKRKRSDWESQRITFRLRLSFLSLNVYYYLIMWLVPDAMQLQLIFSGLLMAGFIPLVKIFSIIEPKKLWLRYQIQKNPNLLSAYTQKEIVNIFSKPIYDFASNIEDIAYFLFPTLGFYFVGEIYFVFIQCFGFFLSFCVDKLILIHLTSPGERKGAAIGLEFFKLFKWDIRLQILTLVCVPGQLYSVNYSGKLRVILLGITIIIIFSDSMSSLKQKWERLWSEKKGKIRYSEVEGLFEHKYEEEYPFVMHQQLIIVSLLLNSLCTYKSGLIEILQFGQNSILQTYQINKIFQFA